MEFDIRLAAHGLNQQQPVDDPAAFGAIAAAISRHRADRWQKFSRHHRHP
jgi:hypothetical protein